MECKVMTKGNDSKVFFEVYKKPKEEGTPKSEDEELKTDAKEDDTGSQQEPPVQSDTKQGKRPSQQEEKSEKKSAPSAGPLGWIKNTREDKTTIESKQGNEIKQHISQPKDEVLIRKDEVILRQETLIIGAIAATFLSIACFFVGHKVGYNKGITSQAEEWLETIEPKEATRAGFGDSKANNSQSGESAEDGSSKVREKTEKTESIVKDDTVIKDKWTLRVVTYKNTKKNVERAKNVAGLLQESLGYNAFVVNTGKELFVCVGEFENWNGTDLTNAQKAVANFEYENKKQFKGCYPVRIR